MQQLAVIVGGEFTVAKQPDDGEFGESIVDDGDVVVGHTVQRRASADAVAQATAVNGPPREFGSLLLEVHLEVAGGGVSIADLKL